MVTILKPRPSFTRAGLESDGRYPIGRRDILPPNPDHPRLNRQSAIVTNPDSRKPGAVTATEPLPRRNAGEVSNRGAQGTYSQSTRPKERENPKANALVCYLQVVRTTLRLSSERSDGAAVRQEIHTAPAPNARNLRWPKLIEAPTWRRESCNGGMGPGVVWWRSTPEWLSRHRS
jgi:hypothetical protein